MKYVFTIAFYSAKSKHSENAGSVKCRIKAFARLCFHKYTYGPPRVKGYGFNRTVRGL